MVKSMLLKEFCRRGKFVGLVGSLAGVSLWIRMGSSAVGRGPQSLGEYVLGLLLAIAGCGVLGLLYSNLCADLQNYLCFRGCRREGVLDARVKRVATISLCASIAGTALTIWNSDVKVVVLAGAFILAWGLMSSLYVAGKSCGRLRLAKSLAVLVLGLSLCGCRNGTL